MYNIITIERRYASGGNEIGNRLAKELGFELYERNILVEAAKNLDIPYITAEDLEESGSGNILLNLSQTPLGGFSSNKARPLAEQLFLEEERIIMEAAKKGNCVIVGRASGYILKEMKNCLKVFIYADSSKRIRRAMEREGFEREEAIDTMRKNDKRRSGFFKTVAGKEWDDPKQYELYINAGSLGVDMCVNLLKAAVEVQKK